MSVPPSNGLGVSSGSCAVESESITSARVADGGQDRNAACRLRYDVYIEEQGKPYPEADHCNRLLTDDLDIDGEIIVAQFDGHIVGTLRANWFDSAATRARYRSMFELDRFSLISPAQIAVCSRLAASHDHRHCRARELLFETVYRRGLQRGTRLCFAACAPLLLRMFRKYGFREYAGPLNDPIVGRLHRTLLVLDDLQHLARVASPFDPIAKGERLRPQDQPWLDRIFDEYKGRHENAD